MKKMNNTIKENIKSVYKKYAKEFDENIASLEIYDESYNCLLGKIHENSTVLDLACGPGNVSYYLKKHIPDLEITGVDISEEMIDIAKRRIQDGRFIVKDICDISFKTKFDCVVCAFAIPFLNLQETAHVISTVRQSLKSNGYFYLSFMEGSKEGFEKQSFTHNDELFIYYHPEASVLKIIDQQFLSVIKKFEIDYHEQDGTITNEIVFIGTLSHNKTNSAGEKNRGDSRNRGRL